MRFIVDDPRIHGYLEGWTRNETLEAHSFFFWASGEVEQRSQAGLLRSILQDVLQKHPDFIALVFGEEWRKHLELARHDMPLDFKSWSLSSLQRYFKSVISRASAQLCFASLSTALTNMMAVMSK
jgi:hypothetical protein